MSRHVSLDLSSVASSSVSALDTDRVTLPSLCSNESAAVDFANDEADAEFYYGQPALKEKVSVWDSSQAGRIDDYLGLRRKLHTPPEIRQRITEMRKSKSESESGIKGGLDLDVRGTPTFSRGDLMTRQNSAVKVSREVLNRIHESREKKKAMLAAQRRIGSGQGGQHYHHAHASPYLRSDRESAQDLAQRRASEEAMKRDRGVVTTTRKKPVSPPRTASNANATGSLDLPPALDSADAAAAGSGAGEDDSPPANRKITLEERLALNDSILQEQYKNYFGLSARKALHLKFTQSSQALERMPNDNDVPEEMRTPRQLYLRGVDKAKILPLSLPVRKSKNPRGVFLGGRGLGDERVLPIIQVIDTLPAVETIDLSDNRMTDASLVPLTEKLTKLTTLTHLDLSSSKMDKSNQTIMAYITLSDCTLKTLVLRASDVDDYEVGSLCDAMIKNHTITTLCLARNLLGSEEHVRINKPGVELGGEGLARLIANNDTLTSLDLSWNSLKGVGAVAIGRSLKYNNTLRTLLLQYNSFGDLGTQNVGWALKYNKSLTHVDLSNNSIVPRSACVLANALAHNTTLRHLNISDNMLGRVGSQAVVAAIQRTQELRRAIGFANCDCEREDRSLFDPAKPQGIYELDLSEPYCQMVAEEILFLANYRAGCTIDKLTYKGSMVTLVRKSLGAKKFNVKDLQATSKLAAKEIIKGKWDSAAPNIVKILSMFGFTMETSMATEVAQVVGKNWQEMQERKDRTEDLHEVLMPRIFYALFLINDEDGSSSMELGEFISTLESLGVTGCDNMTAKKLMEQQDKEGTGSIYPSEFAMIMVHNFCRVEQPRGTLVDKRTGQPWPVPSTGMAVFEVKFIIESAQSFDVGGDDGIQTLVKGILSAKTSEQREILFDQACMSPYFFFTADQAQTIFDAARDGGISRLPLDLIVNILPQIVDEEQTNMFLDNNLTDMGKLALRVKLGTLYNAFVGLSTGHYFVDLSKTLDRMGAKRVGAVAVNEARLTRSKGSDVSQKGNGTNFRNEMIGRAFTAAAPVVLTGQWFADCPKSGELRFDYVSSSKVLVGTMPMSQSRLEALIETLDLRSILALKPRAEELVAEIEAAQENLSAAQEEISERSRKKGYVDSEALSGGLNVRDIMRLRDLKDILKYTERRVYEEPSMKVLPPLQGLGSVKDHYVEIIRSSHHFTDIMPQERQRDVSRMNYNPDPDFRPPTPDVLQEGPKPDHRKMPAIYPYAYRKLLELQIRMPTLYLTCAQVVQLMNLFPEEGYQRLQVLTSVFSHIIDSENVSLIYDKHCSLDEQIEMIHRLGILCVMDPVKPDREYKLDLRRWDQREWCKVLIQLAINEPGDNWIDGGEYRWSKYDDPVPGWLLPGPWTMPDESSDGEGGPRKHGWLRVTYTSTAKGCEIAPQVRRNLRKRTLAGLKTTT